MQEVTPENFEKMARINYIQPFVDTLDFKNDLKTLITLTKRIEKFSRRGQINLRLTFNTFIIATNCFERLFVFKSLFVLGRKEFHNDIFTFLKFFAGFDGPLYVNKELIIDFNPILYNKTLKRMIEEELKK